MTNAWNGSQSMTMLDTSTDRSTAVNNDGAWRILSNIMVLEGADSRNQAAAKIADAGPALALPDSVLAQLRAAISEAVQSVPDRGSSPGLLIVRLFVRETTRSDDARLPPVQGGHRRTGQGWSFFIVQKRTNSEVPASAEHVDVIELFLYQE